MPQKPLLSNDQLSREFSALLVKIRRILSKPHDWKDKLETCKEFCMYLKASGSTNVSLFSQEKLTEINKCEDFRQFFGIVEQHISWGEHFILNEIINLCDSKEAEQEFDKYKRKLAVSKALEIISSTKSDPPPGFEKFCVVIDKPYIKLTIEKYEEIKKFIFDNLDIHHYVTNVYIRMLLGSLHLEWHVTAQAVPHMSKMAHKQQAIFKDNFYVFMQIGKEVIFDTRTEWIPVSFIICIKV